MNIFIDEFVSIFILDGDNSIGAPSIGDEIFYFCNMAFVLIFENIEVFFQLGISAW